MRRRTKATATDHAVSSRERLSLRRGSSSRAAAKRLARRKANEPLTPTGSVPEVASGAVWETRASDSQSPTDNLESHAIARLVFLCRVRSQIVSAMLRLSNQIDAMDRLRTGVVKKGGKLTKRTPTPEDIVVALITTGHLAPHLEGLKDPRRAIEKEIAELSTQLEVAPFVEGVRGFGVFGLGLIVGGAGDLSSYANPAKLWKRFGLAVFDGERQRRVKDTDLALKYGYSPRRRSLMHVIGDSLLKGNGKSENPEYRAVYDSRKVHTLTTHADWSDMHRHMDALRYMEKRLLRNLWRAWHHQSACDVLPAGAMADGRGNDSGECGLTIAAALPVDAADVAVVPRKKRKAA